MKQPCIDFEIESTYELLLNSVNIGIAVINPNMEIVVLNDQASKWFPDIDVTQRPICHRHINRVNPNQICDNCPVVETFKDGLTHEVIKRIPSDNPISYYKVISSPILSKTGQIIGVIETIEDITESLKNENAQKESEFKYRMLFNTMHNAVAIYKSVDNGKNFIFVDFNKTAEKIEKVTRANLLGKNVLEIFPGVRTFGLLEVFQRVWETGKPEHFPLKLYKDDRIEGWKENYVFKLPSGEIVAIYTDETEKKTKELEIENLSKFPSENPNPIIRFSNDGTLLYHNKTSNLLLETLDCSKEISLSGYWLYSIQDAFHSGRIKIEEIVCGQTIYSLTITPFTGSGYITIYGCDITRLKESENKLRASESKLQEQKILLEQKNIDLKEILSQLEKEKDKIKENILFNVENILLPEFQKIYKKADSSELMHLNIIKTNLEQILSSLGIKLKKTAKLSPKEIQLCTMIKTGLSTKEISKLLNISARTIDKHRNSIRKKLGLSKEKINLISYLQNLE